MPGHEQLIIDIGRSRQLTYLLFLIHGLAVATLFLLSMPLILTAVVIILLAFSLGYYTKKTHEVVRIVAKPDNEWLIQKLDGHIFPASLDGNTYISGWLTLLVFTSSKKSLPTSVCLMRDSVTASDLSLLKLYLKISNHQPNASSHSDLSA